MPSNGPTVNITEEGKKSLLGFLEAAAIRGLGDGFDYARDLPGFIADDTPRTVPFAAAKGIARQACRNWARGNTPQNLPGFDAFWAGTCEPYLESIGENPGDGTVGPPFRGGQCPGVSYEVRVEGPGSPPGGPGFATRQGVGPVQGLCFPSAGFGNLSIGVVFANGCVIGGGGQALTIGDVSGQWKIVSITPVSGGPDTCGDPPPQYDPAPVPPGLPPLPPFSPINIPGIGPVDIGVDFNPDGTISITAPDLGIEFNAGDPSGTSDGDDDGAGNGAGDQTDPGDPGSPEDTGPGGDSEGEAEEGEELVGLLVEVIEAPEGANVFANNASQPFRGIGYVRMGYPNRLGLDISGGTVISPQFFHAQQRGLTKWAVNANLGFILRTTPYYRSITP